MDKYLLIELFLILFISAFLCLPLYQLYVSLHEDIHENIFNDFGVEAEKKVGFLSGETVGVIKDKIDKEDYIAMNMLHNINDIVGYHMSVLLFSMFTIITLFIILLFSISSKLEEIKIILETNANRNTYE